MPVILCNETKASSYDGGYEINDRMFGFAKKTFKTVYQVQADNANQNEDDILATSGIPPLWLNLRGGYCIKRQAKEINTQALLWEVTCDFSSQINPENADNTDPESAAPQWTWGVEFTDRLMQKDVNGKPIRSTAGEPILYEHPVVVPILTITRYQAAFDPLTIINYCNHVNKTPFWGVPKGSVLCSGIADSQKTINDTNYRQVTYTFKVMIDYETGTLKSDAWQLELLNHGTYYFCDPFGTSTPETRFDDVYKCSFEDSKKRENTGNLNEDGTPNKDSDPATLHYEVFEPYREAEFNSLALGPW